MNDLALEGSLLHLGVLVMNIVINAINSNSGGGKSIRDSLINKLNNDKLTDNYFIFISSDSDLDYLTNSNLHLVRFNKIFAATYFAPFLYAIILPLLLLYYRPRVVFNLGDLIIVSSFKQVYLFDWAYALNVHPKVWDLMSPYDRFVRKSKLFLFKLFVDIPDIIIAQSDLIKTLIKDKYSLTDVRVVGNATTISTDNNLRPDIALPSGFKFLYPALYYPHKNHDVLIDLAKMIKDSSLTIRIIVTVSLELESARVFSDKIKSLALDNIIVNIGQVSTESMPFLYKSCDAMIMPTLLESFSISYMEAMEFGLPILTSDLDFAVSVCGDAAEYFDPLDPKSIYESVVRVYSDQNFASELVNKGRLRLNSFPDWDANYQTFVGILKEF